MRPARNYTTTDRAFFALLCIWAAIGAMQSANNHFPLPAAGWDRWKSIAEVSCDTALGIFLNAAAFFHIGGYVRWLWSRK